MDAQPSTFVTRPPAAEDGHRLWTLADLRAMLDAGVLQEGEQTELIGGELFVMPSEGSLHDSVLERLTWLLDEAFGGDVKLRQNGPLNLPPDTQVAPDLSVWPLSVWGDDKIGSNALLVVEICRSTRHNDFVVKSARYAGGGVPEYWILEPEERRLTVRRAPVDGVWTFDEPWVATQIATLFAPNAAIDWRLSLDPPTS